MAVALCTLGVRRCGVCRHDTSGLQGRVTAARCCAGRFKLCIKLMDTVVIARECSGMLSNAATSAVILLQDSLVEYVPVVRMRCVNLFQLPLGAEAVVRRPDRSVDVKP